MYDTNNTHSDHWISKFDEYHMIDERKYCRQTLVSVDAVTVADSEAKARLTVEAEEGDDDDDDDGDGDIYRNNK